MKTDVRRRDEYMDARPQERRNQEADQHRNCEQTKAKALHEQPIRREQRLRRISLFGAAIKRKTPSTLIEQNGGELAIFFRSRSFAAERDEPELNA
jgi:hypothetical protein